MTILTLALVALALAVGWAVDAYWQRREAREDYGRLEDRIGELGRQLQAMRRRGVGLPARPVVRWHEDIERRIHKNPGGI